MSDDEFFGEAFDAADADFDDEPEFASASDSPAESEAESDEESAAGSDDAADADDAEAASASEAPARPEAPRADAFARAVQRPRAIHVVAAADRATSDRLQQTEAAGLLAHRAAQIAATGRHFAPADVAAGVADPVRLAYLELFARRCPIMLRREVGTAADGAIVVEDWCPRDMVLPVLPMGDGSDPDVFPSL